MKSPVRSTVRWLAVAFAVTCAWTLAGRAQEPARPDRGAAERAMKAGNWKIAYENYRGLVLDPADDPRRAGDDLAAGLAAIARLGTWEHWDQLIEDAAKVHARNPRLLWAAARAYLEQSQPYGTIIAGAFTRGPQRGGDGRFVYTGDRDRVRALQLCRDAMPLWTDADEPDVRGQYYLQVANAFLTHRGRQAAWRLQELTDLGTLPDYLDYQYAWSRDAGAGGAPVDVDGAPVFHHVPESWDKARTDGERWRWCLERAAAVQPSLAPSVRWLFAEFLRGQFDVQTLAAYGWFFARGDDDAAGTDAAAFSVSSLKDDETIARLATGVKRFHLPDEFNFFRMFQELTEGANPYAAHAVEMLARILEDRRQYPRAAEYWRTAIQRFGSTPERKHHLDQLTGNWGQFEPVSTQPAGHGATVDFRFRNGRRAEFEAFEVDVPTFLDDLRAYLKSNPPQLDWQKLQPEQIGYRLVQGNESRYVKGSVAKWSLDLEPRAKHFDRRITVTTPLQKPGAYLLVSQMQDGNTSRILLWVADTVIVKKPLDKACWWFVADAITGQPVAGAQLDFFGYQQRWDNAGRRHQVQTVAHTYTTDADGQLILPPQDEMNQYSWLVTATTGAAAGGRLAFQGWSQVWWANGYDQEYNQVKVFGITDRPVYRPAQTMKYKFWIGHAKYDQADASQFAGQDLTVTLTNPKGETIGQQALKADAYGGVQGEFPLARDAALGVYGLQVNQVGGGTSFRVEEYKKPEFEVTIDAPDAPVMLGEKVTATIKAKYLFGAPVNEGKVKYKVLRTPHTAGWYPSGYWDWFYGPGYWWFACDYAWYPGWGDWGCRRPIPWWWWGWNAPVQPEVVAEVEAALGADGVVKVEIDTAVAKAMHGDQDHAYQITAEVTDPSRRTIVGQGSVLVARKPFKVYAWVDRGHYREGDTVHAAFSAQTLAGQPVRGKGALRLLRVGYGADGKPTEGEVEKWDLDPDARGRAEQQFRAAQGGQYRLSYAVTDAAGHAIEGGYLFTVAGAGFGDGAAFRFNALELVPDKREYAPGEKVQLQVNVNRTGGTVVFFTRPANSVYQRPTILRLTGKSRLEEIAVTQRDMPNFFVEALTVADGRVHVEMREIIVPPASRVLNVEAKPSAERLKPGEKAKVKLRLTDTNGEPFRGSTVVSMYDKAVEYISGGSNVPDIREFFWKWRRSHRPQQEHTLARGSAVLLKQNEAGLAFLGVFGGRIDEGAEGEGKDEHAGRGERRLQKGAMADEQAAMEGAAAAPGAAMESEKKDAANGPALAGAPAPAGGGGGPGAAPAAPALVQPTVRQNFADTALWVGALETDAHGEAEVEVTMPENLTAWRTRVWALGAGTRVGETSVEVVTAKDLIVRLQAPRFFVQKDEVVLSANVHNYLKSKKSVSVALELEGGCLEVLEPAQRTLEVEPDSQKRVDWRVKVVVEGEAVVRMKALTDEESDAMQMRFPVYVHGILKTDSFSGVVRPEQDAATATVRVPAERRPEQSRLEVRYSPTLAGALVDALPYMVGYPYGCTEQTLNRFLPTVMTQNVLLKMGVDLKDVRAKRTNLNAQEIGDDRERAKDWKRARDAWGRLADEDPNPVFDPERVKDMVRAGVERLASMQVSDGGWGWFSGYGEQSWPHTTAYVVHGLQLARDNDVKLPGGMLERGLQWLTNYQKEQVAHLKLPKTDRYYKPAADALDAFIYMVLVDAKQDDREMREFLFRDKNDLPVYAKAMFGLALKDVGDATKLAEVLTNIEQYLVQDNENQTAYLRLPENNWWWCWYGSEYEAQAYYLKLLAATDPKGEKASRLVKYLVNNRRHATYWNSTRDTAVCIEALAEYLIASGEDAPDLTVEVWLGGKKLKEEKITKANLFTFDNRVVVAGADLAAGEAKLEVRRRGKGRVYFNAYLTNFTLEDPIGPAGLEVKVERKVYKLEREEASTTAAGERGQVVSQKVEKYRRIPLVGGAVLKSGDLVEVELEIESKNDYEYVIFEDLKAAGFEPVDVRSGYTGNDLNAYVEFRDERVCFFARTLARGRHSVAYRLRAEIPGKFSALPARASAMYAPELKANSSEAKLAIQD